jgi:anti-sigma-K factor RskA
MSQELHTLVAPYALGALDADERERFERHLADCEQCSVELGQLQEPLAALAYAAEGPAPPPSLRGRILAAARDDPRAAVYRLPRRKWVLPAAVAVAAVAACAAIGLGIWASSLSRSLDRERSAKAAYDRAAQLLAAKANAKPLVGADGSLLVAKDGRAAIVVCGLDRAPGEKTYEAWVISGKTPQPAGLFRGVSGCEPIALTRSVPKGATVAVTLERAGGATTPTLPIVFRAETA